MTEHIEKAFAKIFGFSVGEQDLLAQSLLDQLAADKKWDKTFANSQDELSTLADEALAEHRDGRMCRLEALPE